MMLERETLTELLVDVSKIEVVELKPEWFDTKEFRYMVEDVNEHKDSDHVLMLDRIQERYTDSTMDKEEIINLFAEGLTNARLKDHAREMKVRFYEKKVRERSEAYTFKPTEDMLNKLKDVLVELNEVQGSFNEQGLKEAVAELYDEMENGMKSGIHTFEKLDRIVGDGMAGGMLITIGSRPAVGKSSFGVNLVLQALKNEENVTVDFYGLEMIRKELLKKTISAMTEINSYKFVNTKLHLDREEKNKVVASATYLEGQDLNIIDNLYYIDDIVRSIKRRKEQAKGNYIAFIDYLQLVQSDQRHAQRYLVIGEITRKLKKLANTLDIPIVIFSQLSRGVEAREDKTPNLADLRESGDIEQDSNIVAFLSNDAEEEGIVKFTIAKNRNGATATIPFRFFKSKSLFVEVEE